MLDCQIFLQNPCMDDVPIYFKSLSNCWSSYDHLLTRWHSGSQDQSRSSLPLPFKCWFPRRCDRLFGRLGQRTKCSNETCGMRKGLSDSSRFSGTSGCADEENWRSVYRIYKQYFGFAYSPSATRWSQLYHWLYAYISKDSSMFTLVQYLNNKICEITFEVHILSAGETVYMFRTFEFVFTFGRVCSNKRLLFFIWTGDGDSSEDWTCTLALEEAKRC